MNSALNIQPNPLKGILLMMLSLFMLTCSDAATKWLGDEYPAGEIICIRALFSLMPIVIMVGLQGGLKTLRIVDKTGQLWRAFYFAASSSLIAISMIILPIADAAAVLYAGPLMISALAVPLLNEKIGWRRWIAIAVGFVGVTIMLRPTPNAFQWVGFFPLAAAFCSSMRDIWARRLSNIEHANSLMFWSAIATIVLSGCALPYLWTMPSSVDWLLLLVSGAFIGIAHYFMIEAYRTGEASVVSPFKYSGIIWAVLFGYVIWNDIPDIFVLCGGGIVIISGLYILHRETTPNRSV